MAINRTISVFGGGCAGYSLIKELSKINGIDINFYLGTDSVKDNYWGFWKNKNDSFHFPIHAKWYKWKISDWNNEVDFESQDNPYCIVKRSEWYNFCKNEASSKSVKFIRENINENNGIYYRKNREVIKSDYIFDCRTKAFEDEVYKQQFKGFLIQVNESVFDSSVVNLMDFRCNQEDGIQFIYLLPFSSRLALIEPTTYSYSTKSNDFYLNTLKKYLLEIYNIKDFKILNEEKGIIPLALLPADNNTAISVGVRGRANRPASGYTFYFIQLQVKKAFDCIIKRKDKFNLNIHSLLIRFLDNVFLDVLKSNPKLAPKIFISFAKSFTGNELADFMTNRIKLKSLFQMIMNLPKLPFIKSFFRNLF